MIRLEYNNIKYNFNDIKNISIFNCNVTFLSPTGNDIISLIIFNKIKQIPNIDNLLKLFKINEFVNYCYENKNLSFQIDERIPEINWFSIARFWRNWGNQNYTLVGELNGVEYGFDYSEFEDYESGYWTITNIVIDWIEYLLKYPELMQYLWFGKRPLEENEEDDFYLEMILVIEKIFKDDEFYEGDKL